MINSKININIENELSNLQQKFEDYFSMEK